jgi:predicted lipoprotein with Yx(FWY)xxD motif
MTNRVNDPQPRLRHSTVMRRLTMTLGAVGMVGVMATGSVAAAMPATLVPQRIVKVADRPPFGNMLTTRLGASLYLAPTTGCTGGCLTAWPPLYIHKGRAPRGTPGLGTVKVMVEGVTKIQVTYHGRPLNTFIGDSGTSVTGNGVDGFTVAVVS